MNAEYLTALAVLIGIAISFRTTSHTELRSLYDALRNDFDKYRTEARKREEEADDKINDLERKVIKYERYISRLISQLEHNSIVPEPMDKE
jgi:hypothetical protein